MRVVLDIGSFSDAEEIGVLATTLPGLLRQARHPLLVPASGLAREGDARPCAIARCEAVGDLLARLHGDGLLRIVDDGSLAASSAAGELLGNLLRFELKHRITLITQNPECAAIARRNSCDGAIRHARRVRVLRVADGGLRPWPEAGDDTASAVIARHRGRPELRRLAADFALVADTSSLMLTPSLHTAQALGEDMPLGPRFFGEFLLPLMQQAGRRLIVPLRVCEELGKHAASPEQRVGMAARRALAVLDRYRRADCLQVCKDDEEIVGGGATFADPVLLQAASRFQHRKPLCFITQDRQLAQQLLASQRSDGKPLRVVRIVERKPGQLSDWQFAKDAAAAPPRCPKPAATSTGASQRVRTGSGGFRQAAGPAAAPVRPFRASAALVAGEDRILDISVLPGSGQTVVSTRLGRLVLGAPIASGGEGCVYETDREGVVCKIYQPGRATSLRRAKLELMLSRELSLPGVCWPIDTACNDAGEFVGYLMPRASGKLLRLCAFDKASLQRHFPAWRREHLATLAITVLEAVLRLHRLNVLIGDINPRNILIESEHKVWLIDMDSVQVEGYPCPVGEVLYTPARHQGRNFGSFLRTREDEAFALATLLFQILLPGKAPYAAQGGDDMAENIRERRFPYEKDSDIRPPSGTWQFIWSNLSYALRDGFQRVFLHDERLSVEQWIALLDRYRDDIRRGARSNEPFPTRPWVPANDVVQVECETCPPGARLHEAGRRHIERLHSEGKTFRCTQCNVAHRLARLHDTREVRCAAASSPNCQGHYQVRAEEFARLRAEGRLPCCRECRGPAKARPAQPGKPVDRIRAGARPAASPRPQRHRPQSGPSPQAQAAPCFVATATYRSQTAEPVVFLRAYRDRVLAGSPAGRAFIAGYYRGGPWLAALVDCLPVLRPLSRALLDRLVARLRRRHPDLSVTP